MMLFEEMLLGILTQITQRFIVCAKEISSKIIPMSLQPFSFHYYAILRQYSVN